jgi:hypothetical protein
MTCTKKSPSFSSEEPIDPHENPHRSCLRHPGTLQKMCSLSIALAIILSWYWEKASVFAHQNSSCINTFMTSLSCSGVHHQQPAEEAHCDGSQRLGHIFLEPATYMAHTCHIHGTYMPHTWHSCYMCTIISMTRMAVLGRSRSTFKRVMCSSWSSANDSSAAPKPIPLKYTGAVLSHNQIDQLLVTSLVT